MQLAVTWACTMDLKHCVAGVLIGESVRLKIQDRGRKIRDPKIHWTWMKWSLSVWKRSPSAVVSGRLLKGGPSSSLVLLVLTISGLPRGWWVLPWLLMDDIGMALVAPFPVFAIFWFLLKERGPPQRVTYRRPGLSCPNGKNWNPWNIAVPCLVRWWKLCAVFVYSGIGFGLQVWFWLLFMRVPDLARCLVHLEQIWFCLKTLMLAAGLLVFFAWANPSQVDVAWEEYSIAKSQIFMCRFFSVRFLVQSGGMRWFTRERQTRSVIVGIICSNGWWFRLLPCWLQDAWEPVAQWNFTDGACPSWTSFGLYALRTWKHCSITFRKFRHRSQWLIYLRGQDFLSWIWPSCSPTSLPSTDCETGEVHQLAI